jgi:hypothetical protein
MNPIAITLLLAISLIAFGALAWRKLAIVVRLAPEARWDHPLARFHTVLVKASCSREWSCASGSRASCTR